MDDDVRRDLHQQLTDARCRDDQEDVRHYQSMLDGMASRPVPKFVSSWKHAPANSALNREGSKGCPKCICPLVGKLCILCKTVYDG